MIILHRDVCIENSKLPRLETSDNRRVECFRIRALDVAISIVLLTHHKVKCLLVVGTVPDRLVPQLRKEVLAGTLQDVVLILVREHHLLTVVRYLDLNLGALLLVKDASHGFFLVIDVKDFDDLAATVLFAGDGAVGDSGAGVLGIKNHIKYFFMIFTNDKLGNLLSLILRRQMPKHNLHFGYNCNKSLL
jgi:hypothetical protein